MGSIDLKFVRQAAPRTVQYIERAIKCGLFNGNASFYRSDFVIQCGLHGSGVSHPDGDLTVNETAINQVVTNDIGTASIAHFDVPDCGNTEFFINLQHNTHLDSVYGGYCVFTRVDVNDQKSWNTVYSIRDAIKNKTHSKVRIREMKLL